MSLPVAIETGQLRAGRLVPRARAVKIRRRKRFAAPAADAA